MQDHDVLREGKQPLVRCSVCGHTHRIHAEREKGLFVKTIVSSGEESRVCVSELERNGVYRVGDQVVVECGEEIQSVEITGIETMNRRVERAEGVEVQTLWTRATQEVTVKISLHEGRSTVPLYLQTLGTEEFVVDREYEVGGRRFRISHIKLRNDRFLRREGERAPARSVKRIYAVRS
jgi:uncharacterized Zn finger protein